MGRTFGAGSVAALICLCGLLPLPADAHGFAGKRFFPATLSIDDPAVGPEVDILFGHTKAPNDDGTSTNANTTELEFSQLITRRFGLSIGTEYDNFLPAGEKPQRGFNNLEIGAKYLALVNARHEAMVSFGLDAEFGGTGARAVSDSFSTISPTVFFGKGFGDLPESFKYLRPVAITGAIAPNFTTSAAEPDSLDWGFTFQYNLQYLQSFVKDVGLSAPFDHVIPIVETPMSTCLGQGCGGQTTGTINPGLIWFGRYGQIGLEATIPVNQRSGNHVGVLVQLHLYLDDLFPHSLGKPLFQ
ncbi:MAG: hypothetical protein ACRET1_01470 [Burkholderiales bacterium]